MISISKKVEKIGHDGQKKLAMSTRLPKHKILQKAK